MSMSNNSSILQSWINFINQVVKKPAFPENYLGFPKRQILAYMAKQQCPCLKDLLQILPEKYINYKINPAAYIRQLLVLIYMIVIKGSNARTVCQMIQQMLIELLRYRLIVIIGNKGLSQMVQIYNYFDEWLEVIVPKILSYEDMIVSIFTKLLNKGIIQSSNSIIGGCNRLKQDDILLIFHSLLVSKVSYLLSKNSLTQFSLFILQNYPQQYSHYLLKIVQSYLLQQQLPNLTSSINLKYLCHLRQSQDTPFTQNLQSVFNQDYRIQLISSTTQISQQFPCNQWVINAYYQQPQLISNLVASLQKNNIMEIYEFLMNIEIYASSPKIQVLNDYLIEEGKVTEEDVDNFLEFFSQFLMGEIPENRVYRYGEDSWRDLLQTCMKKLDKIQLKNQWIFVNQLQSQIQLEHI